MTQAKIGIAIDAEINQSNSTSCFKVLSYLDILSLIPILLHIIVTLHISIINDDKNPTRNS